jgi:serine/threonine protein kinase
LDSTAREDAILPEIGKYHLVAELARGGMGVVYLAALQGPGGFNKLLALKELKPELCEDETYVAMFMDEARLAARLVHPNIVQTNEVGSEGKRHYMVMEFLDGRSLHRIGRRAGEPGRLSTGALLRIISDAVRGLHYAHELHDFDGAPLGIVHRDVSPLNVFVTFDGQSKVLDFGIAKAVDSSMQTATGVLKGRVAYMAPEQAWGNKVDRRADVYAAGVMLWEAAAGRRLWPGMSEVEILARALREGPPSLRSVRPDVPADLDAICARAMAKHCDDRYATAADLVEDLETHLARRADMMTMREVGALVSRAFADERKKMNVLIEKTLTRVRGGPRSGVMPTFEAEIAGGTHGGGTPQSDSSVLRDESGNMSARRVRTPTGAAPTMASAAPPPQAMSAAPETAPEEVRRPWISNRVALVTSAGALLASALIVAALRGGAPAPQAEIAPTGARPAAATMPEVDLVDVAVRVSPPSAQISIDGAPVPTNPFHARYPKDRAVHHIAASSDGYESKLEDVTFAGDVSVDVSLDHRLTIPTVHRAPPPPAPAPPPFRPVKRSGAPPAPTAESSAAPSPSPSQPEVNPSGGRAPLRPIVTSNPYGAP